MKLESALAALDPGNDGHWTTDGAPRLDVLSEIMKAKVKRKDIAAVAPLFTRENPKVGEEKSGPADGGGVPLAPDSQRRPPDLALTDDDTLADLREQEAKLGEEINRLTRAKEDVRNRADVIAEKIERERPKPSNQQNIRDYLDRQAQLREERGAAERSALDSSLGGRRRSVRQFS